MNKLLNASANAEIAAANVRAARNSFYSLQGKIVGVQRCAGLACFAAHGAMDSAVNGDDHSPIFCLGRCYAAPAQADDTIAASVQVQAKASVLCGNLLLGG
jgi:hypothetical protein